MIDLKPFYDAVLTADEALQRIANQIQEHFNEGTDEGQAAALAMRPALDEAQNRYDQASEMYEAMQKAGRPNDIAKNFVPVSETNPDPADNSQPSVIKREDYERLSLVDRAKFIRSGGTLED